MNSVMIWILIPTLLFGLPLLLVFGSFAWHNSQTKGLAYFGRPKVQRERFHHQVQVIGRLLRPIIRLMAGRNPDPNQFTVKRGEWYFPASACSKASLDFACNYEPQANDVFVVTPMKCGTTWMQQIVYEILMKGEGDFSDSGHRHLFATSPWLESFNGVPLAEAPLLGSQQLRLIKSHLPAAACPFSESAKYIYVMRHPGSCFASSVDFFRANAGDLSPTPETMLDWFCSDRMWWGSWVKHVAGFYERHQKCSNILFISFEDMKADLPGVIERVAEFLNVDLTEPQYLAIQRKSSFSYMKEHEEQFEMLAPGFFATGDSFFPSGSANRFDALSPQVQTRISEYVRAELQGDDFPLADFYPDVAEVSQRP